MAPMITYVQGNSPVGAGVAGVVGVAGAAAAPPGVVAVGVVSTGVATDALESMKTPKMLKCLIVAETVRASLFTDAGTFSHAFEIGLYHFTVIRDVS